MELLNSYFHTKIPISPIIGDIYYDISADEVMIFDGKIWMVTLGYKYDEDLERNRQVEKRIKILEHIIDE